MQNKTPITYGLLREFHQSIAEAHNEIKSFYRFDIMEIQNGLRGTPSFPALMMEAPSTQMASQTKMVTNFAERNNSLLIMDFGGALDDFEKQEEVLTKTEEYAMDIQTYLIKCAKDPNHWLFGLFDINTVRIEKVGPLFDNMHGWNILYDLTSFQTMEFKPEKWTF